MQSTSGRKRHDRHRTFEVCMEVGMDMQKNSNWFSDTWIGTKTVSECCHKKPCTNEQNDGGLIC